MKKIVIGCGLALLLVTIAGAAGLYYFVYRPARSFVTSMAQLSEVAELDQQVSNTRSFTAPVAGALTPAQVTRFVAVQEAMHGRLGARATELEAKYKEMSNRSPENHNIAEVVGAYRDVFGLIAEAKRAQVDALNAQQFSLEEYAWVRTRVYEAAGVAITGIDFREMTEKLKDGDFSGVQTPDPAPTVTNTPEAGIPEVNQTLVAPHKDAMQRWFAYAMFGL
ncbi:MAG: hypothetical protein ACR2LU_05465 [Luteitalea sp.]